MKFNIAIKTKIFPRCFLFLFTVSLLVNNNHFYARGTKKIGAVQSVGEQGVRLSVLAGKHTLFTGGKIGYDYRYKKWLQLGGEILFDYAKIASSDAYTLMLGFLPKYTLFSVLKSRLALHAGLGLYGAYENIQNKLLEQDKSAWLYGFAAHGELDFYINSRFLVFGAGKQFLFPNGNYIGIWRTYGEIGIKIMF